VKRPKVLVLAGYQRDEQQLSNPFFQSKYDIIFEEPSKQWLSSLCKSPYNLEQMQNVINTSIDAIDDYCHKNNIDALVSSADYPANVLRVAIGEHLRLSGPSLEAILLLEHKYYSRELQQQCVPEAVPTFHLITQENKNDFASYNTEFPLLIKPVKSSFSYGAFKVDFLEQYYQFIDSCFINELFLMPFNALLAQYTTYEYDACNVIAETFIPGYQTTVEGFIYQGEIVILGIIDSIMFPGTISFNRFEYPSSLEPEVQERMNAIVKKVMSNSGLDNSLFNVECMYTSETDEIHIIEINPRFSSQFADLFERVDGFNTYETLIEIALGRKPKTRHRQGKFKIAASCVLRIFEDHLVERVPSAGMLKRLYELFPDARIEIYAQVGKKLSSEKQDGKSFRYGLVHLGAYDHEDLFNRFEICKQLLNFKLIPLG
jgi:biotin carboxylase